MQVVPTQPVASQQLQCQLNSQAVTLNIYQQAFGLYVDVLVGTSPIIQGVIAEDRNRIVRSAYLGFTGDFVFIDLQAPAGQFGDDPVYTGLGTQFQLVYLTVPDLESYGFEA
ncbi:hypothetical protein IC762_17815 [Bradyrhizobium genosp. L]|uniref:phage baseplate plug family protein n=1 Tax=Bradyrhizobium genosp. L TaxID=83637 RepID=UPI0018A31C48|nr:hypothetical protein [Bradyrhizobium genosp. L]QPF81680.1 hypothetical protein IC762_17815 [Bradyrhizobium genosp. L]